MNDVPIKVEASLIADGTSRFVGGVPLEQIEVYPRDKYYTMNITNLSEIKSQFGDSVIVKLRFFYESIYYTQTRDPRLIIKEYSRYLINTNQGYLKKID